MSPRTEALSGPLRDYLIEVGLREHPASRALREATDALADGGMRSSAEQAALLAFLVELMAARRVLEVGCFTGYGALAMALALPEGGRVTTLDVSDWDGIGPRHWRQAGVEGRIELRLGLAIESLDRLLAEDGQGSFDLAYVDADKKLYDAYYERALALLRPGGVIALDNVFQQGRVADPASHERQTESLRALNVKIRDDARVSPVMLPLGDGLTLARKR